MSSVDSLRTAPWNDLDPALLVPADSVPTMLKQDERQMYFWLARDYVQGAGTVVDLGAYVGGSTAYLASGLKAGNHICDVHAYDRFEIHNDERKQRLLSLGVPAFDGPDVLPAIQQMLSPWIDQVHLHPGDIREKGWNGEPIEILIVDAAKHADTGDHIAETFFPHLIPGRSLVVHQDFLNHRQPWIAAQMALFSDYFEPLILCGQECMVFLNTAPIPKSLIADSKVDPLSNAAYLRALRQISERLEPMVGQRPLRRIRKTAKAHPTIRNAHKLTRALRRAAE